MGSSKKNITCAQVNKTDLVLYLDNLGYRPQKIKGHNHWYLSPLRIEQTASFKVNQQLNRWYDFGYGKGGKLIDFGILYFNCSVKVFLESFCETLSMPPVAETSIPIAAARIKVTATRPLYSLTLIGYLAFRGIDFDLAAKYCQQVHYTFNGKHYFGIGFANNSGGYEIRNAMFKSSSSPKDITTIILGFDSLSVFEGFLDFLSFLKLFDGTPKVQTDYLILNSLIFFEKHLDFMMTYKKVLLYLDNDNAGLNCNALACKTSPVFVSKNRLYKGYKDVNDLLTASCPISPDINQVI